MFSGRPITPVEATNTCPTGRLEVGHLGGGLFRIPDPLSSGAGVGVAAVQDDGREPTAPEAPLGDQDRGGLHPV